MTDPRLLGRVRRGLAEEQVFNYDRHRVGHRGMRALRSRIQCALAAALQPTAQDIAPGGVPFGP